MYVLKRDGRKESIKFDKITARIMKMCYGLDPIVSPEIVAMKVIEKIYDGISTVDLDNLAAEVAATRSIEHPDYALLASRIAVSNLHKETKESFSEVINDLYHYIDPKTGEKAPIIAQEVYEIVQYNKELLDSTIVYDRDFKYDFFGFKNLCRSYLLQLNGEIAERPQQMLMRVAVGIHKRDLASVIQTYNMLSEGWFTHASTTLFNAGTVKSQMLSSFSLSIKEDSIDGIFETLKSSAKVSQFSGGIGLAIHEVRAKGSYVKQTNGTASGIIPMIRVFNDTAKFVNQGGGRRKGSIAVYLEPWHAEIVDFLELKKNHGKEELRARDLSYGLWIPDLFMQRVKENGVWTLMCPNECPGLSNVHGKDFEMLYSRYEKEGKGRETIQAQDLWLKILEAQIETGMPYMLYKDAVNTKSNQQHLGTIKSSNLSTEIVQYTDSNDVAACSLASIALSKFVSESATFDFQKLYDVTYQVAINLNKLIDANDYPIVEAKNTSIQHRPIGIGVQGLADAYILMKYPFESEEARALNISIFETLYFAAITASKDLAKEEGSYESYVNSPTSKGIFQFDLWGVTPSNRWDWETLKQEVKQYGMRNSLLLAPMPTSATAQLLGNNESFEPYASNIQIRRVQSGEFININKHLLKDLVKEGLWTKEIRQKVISSNGSIQHIEEIPAHVKELYKTAWEVTPETIINQAVDRAAFICQSQALNCYMIHPDFEKLTKMHFSTWEKGLKTGMYHLRTKTTANAIKFTVDKNAIH